ncbi:Signal recognition particle subunit SRP68 [Galemys pyrenaicus]|uniref:Signal recognition particle subunit SRP68 n=1 Tax=Galemys pyrenaicus TaxID=202257 RepID=A0A8J6DV24_GALPY|nr:Signal recognition particle subunit SRP68 [Galemys pyrenaicus]
MAAEKQVSGGGGGSGGGSGGGGGGRGAGGEENKENERPSAGSKTSKEFGDSLSLESILESSGLPAVTTGYCSRRQRRLRKTLNFKMGNRHKFTGKKVTEELLTDNRYLLLVLMDAERAWSYAMQLKQEANTEPRKRFHLLSRLRKAVQHAEELERLCESSRVDARTKLEAQASAYTAYLAGMLRFEHQEWKAAIEAFNKCKTIYEKLASAFTEEQAVLYNQRVEEISPNIRYCAYNIGDQSAINELMQMRLRSGGTEGLLAEKLEALITQTRAKQAATMSEVQWRGRTVPVKIDKVRIFLLGLADNEAAIAQDEGKRLRKPKPAGAYGPLEAGDLSQDSASDLGWAVQTQCSVIAGSSAGALPRGAGELAVVTCPHAEWLLPQQASQCAESEETKERLFESMLSECRDALQAVREDLRPDQKQRDYTLDGESGKVSNLQYLHSYLTYIKLSTAIKRNESMAEGLQEALLQQRPEDDSKRCPRPQDLIRLYDIILQNLVELRQLPGLEEDRAFQKELGLKTLVYKAYRCFFIAQSYVLVKKWSEALVLYDRVLKYADEVSADAGAFKSSLKDLPDVQELITQVRSEKCSLQAAAILDASDSHQTETTSQVKDNKPLVERFETFCLDPSLVTKQASLVHFPPGFRPVPCKPLFFDLALNHVAFPPLEDKLEQKTKSGLTGYIKGIFGFRS